MPAIAGAQLALSLSTVRTDTFLGSVLGFNLLRLVWSAALRSRDPTVAKSQVVRCEMAKRYAIPRRASKGMFRRNADRTPLINFAGMPMRGGIRL